MSQNNSDFLKKYQDDGFICPVPAIGKDLASQALKKIEKIEADHGGKWPSEYALKPHLVYPFLDEIIKHPDILDQVEKILGPDIICWQCRFFIKNPGDGGFVSWHQDISYWGVDINENILTAWLAFTPATKGNGVMKVIPGTHKLKLLPHREGAGSALTVRGQEVDVEVDESQAVYMELQTGEMSLHHVKLFHGSDPNESDERRVGLAIRYMPTRAKPLDGLPKDSVTVVRGVDKFNYFHHEFAPKFDMDPVSIQQHKRISETYKIINDMAASRHHETINSQ
jgi:non-haem Fe2+, alpha-ketoglutarate-dependent halogenase